MSRSAPPGLPAPVLRARPVLLEAAVDALPPATDAPRKPRVKVDALRSQLVGIDERKLAALRLTRKARGVFPYLAAEVGDADLHERVLYVAVRSVGRFSWPELARLVPLLYADDDFRTIVAERARREKAELPVKPRWLGTYAQRALAPAEPARALAAGAWRDHPQVCDLLRWLGLRAGTPLAVATLREVVARISDDDVGAQPFTATLRWVEDGGDDAEASRALLRRMLERYAPLAQRPEDLAQGPLAELAAVTLLRLQGGPDQRPGLWQGLGEAALRFGRWAATSPPRRP